MHDIKDLISDKSTVTNVALQHSDYEVLSCQSAITRFLCVSMYLFCIAVEFLGLVEVCK